MAMKIHRHSRGCKTMKIQRPEFGGPLLPRLLPLLLLLLPTRIPATALYFPQSDLSLRLPYPRSNAERFASSIELFELRTLRNDSVEARNTSYRISVPRGELASINLDTKRVFLHRLPREGSATVTIVILARETANSEAVLEMKIWPVPVDGEGLDCADYVEDMCFWRTSRYRIYENQPDTMIGTLRPNVYKDLCPSFHVIGYKLLNGTEYFHIVNDTLFAKESLDRDTVGPPGGPGPRASVQVQCVVWEEVTGRQHAPIKTLDIDVLDQDDNPPTLQGNRSVAITLRDFVAGDKLDEDNLILKDADTRSSNRYTVRILGDAHDALNVTCDVLPIEPPGRAPYTAIYTRIYAKTTLLPKSPYRVILQAKDESLIPGYGENTLNVTVTLFGPEHRTTTTTVSSISTTRRPISYPPSVKIARIASRFARVARPFGGKPHSSLSFAVDGSKGAFDVTRKGGIVYVADEKLLETEAATWTLNLKWSGKDRVEFRGAIRINVMDVPPSKIGACDRNESLVRSCANAERPEDCESRCGVASGTFSKGTFAGQCVWRWNKRSNVSQMSEHYQTCSPDLAHCPDNECDELEELDPRVCPQDCTIESNLHFGIANKGGRGIKSGLGTCACSDDLQCTCNVDRFRTRNENVGKVGREEGGRVEKPRDRENEILVSGARKATGGPCGPICVAGVIGASFFVLVVIVGSLVTSRYRMATKGARREGKRRVEGGPNGTGILPSDYIDRGDGLLIGLDTFATTNPRLLPSKTCPLDPKWEFPRSRLTIEQVLGEGEFGRVLRAKAIDIGGSSGATTVAVKTLKENACASELTDLLSEYQLLKEAQHPNVIRLLGACTTPGGPVYLVIEFAEFGSLRNYLRRSRHLESDGRSDSCAANLLSSNVGGGQRNTDAVPTSTYTVAPRDILSFAWQISKGMAYLADIKLVHRDLAARNVLLATGKVCKISDFGLTRDVYEDDAYLKRSKGRVPVKWMAPESLADHVYTSKSDVWSFGVLLWELVTLGASPYPGIDVHNLYNLLKAGYRMERPANCSPQLYKLMVSCWHQEPASRPSFKELTCHWERMLEDGVEYLDLNPRTVHNQAYFTTSPFPSSEDRPCAPVENDGRDNDEVDVSRTDVVNYLGKPSLDTMTKSDKVDKLGTLWREPVGSFPEDASKMSYVNDRPSSEQRANHYESPIKLRNSSVTSSSENDLVTPTYERPRSYIDMEGKKLPEAEDLLVFNSMDDRNDQDEGN